MEFLLDLQIQIWFDLILLEDFIYGAYFTLS